MKTKIKQYNVQLLLLVLLLFWGYGFVTTFKQIQVSYTGFKWNWHCILVFLLSFYLYARKNVIFSKIAPTASVIGLFAVIGLDVSWLLAKHYQQPVLQQIVVLLLLPSVIWAVCGYKIFRKLSFPLIFLLLALPQNYNLVTLLMKYLALHLRWFFVLLQAKNCLQGLEYLQFLASKPLIAVLPIFALGVVISYQSNKHSFHRVLGMLNFLIIPYTSLLATTIFFAYLSLELELINISVLGFTVCVWSGLLIGVMLAVVINYLLKEKSYSNDSLSSLDWQSSWRGSNKRSFHYSVLIAFSFALIPIIEKKIAMLNSIGIFARGS